MSYNALGASVYALRRVAPAEREEAASGRDRQAN
jgi:hypothetical protein